MKVDSRFLLVTKFSLEMKVSSIQETEGTSTRIGS